MKRYRFKSQSTAGKVYETVINNAGSVTCNCPGWTRRAERICVHTRVVLGGRPELDPLFVGSEDNGNTPEIKPETTAASVARSFQFDE